MTACNGTSSAVNKCVISLTTASDYFSNVKWTKQAAGTDNGNNLLEQGEQFEITVDLNDLGDNKSLSENLTANQSFTLQVKPAVGASISIKRTLPPSIGPVMDLDLGTSFGGGGSSGSSGSGGGSAPSGGGGTPALICTRAQAFSMGGSGVDLHFYLQNNGTGPAHISTSGVTIAVNGGSAQVPNWWVNGESTNPFAVGETCHIGMYSSDTPSFLKVGDTFTVTVTPDGGSTITITRTLPGTLPVGYTELP
jgi:archaellin